MRRPGAPGLGWGEVWLGLGGSDRLKSGSDTACVTHVAVGKGTDGVFGQLLW